MNTFELTPNQEEVLTILIDRYRNTESTVKGSYIAEQANRSPSTISKYMKELRSLNLVESFRGQRGGYRPTADAYRILDSQDMDEKESLFLVRGYDRVDLVVDTIRFPNVLDSENCNAVISFQEPLQDYDVGDLILIGPTPGSHLVVGGEITELTSPTKIQIDVQLLEAPISED